MKKLIPALALAALIPLGGCVAPYGYSSGAYAGYDGGFDSGYQGYGNSNSGYGYGEPGYYQYSDAQYYGGYGAPAYGPPVAYPQSYSTPAPYRQPLRKKHAARLRCRC